MYCDRCGAPSRPEAHFCQHCGTARAAAPPPATAAAQPGSGQAQVQPGPPPAVAPAQPRREPVALWSHTVVGAVAFLLTPPAGLVLAALNYRRMGLVDKARVHAILAGVGTVLFAVLALAGGVGRLLIVVMGIGLYFYLYERMRADLAAFTAADHEVHSAPWGLGGLIGLGVAALVLVVPLTLSRATGAGTGTISFGTDYRETRNGFEIMNPRTTFGPRDVVAYVADFNERPGTTNLDELLAHVSPSGSENVVHRETFDIADPNYAQLAARFPIAELMARQPAGTYTLKLLRGSTILAEGTFTYDPRR